MRLIDKGLILILVPLLFELLFVGTIVYMLRQADEQAASEARAGAKLFHVNNLMRLALEQSIVDYVEERSGAGGAKQSNSRRVGDNSNH